MPTFRYLAGNRETLHVEIYLRARQLYPERGHNTPGVLLIAIITPIAPFDTDAIRLQNFVMTLLSPHHVTKRVNKCDHTHSMHAWTLLGINLLKHTLSFKISKSSLFGFMFKYSSAITSVYFTSEITCLVRRRKLQQIDYAKDTNHHRTSAPRMARRRFAVTQKWSWT